MTLRAHGDFFYCSTAQQEYTALLLYLITTKRTSTKINNDKSNIMIQTRRHDVLQGYVTWACSIDGICCCAFLCNILALCLPVLLVPLAIQEELQLLLLKEDETIALMVDSGMVAAHVARVCSLAFLGGAVGKFVNGFVCDEILGPYTCSKWYLIGMGMCSLLFSWSSAGTAAATGTNSTSTNTMGLAFAGMEFFASVQYAALSIMLSNYYTHSETTTKEDSDHQQQRQQQAQQRLNAAWTALGLASTVGEVLAKTLGSALNVWLHWRRVAQLGAVVCFFGALIVAQAPGQAAEKQHAQQQQQQQCAITGASPSFSWKRILESLVNILGTRVFWRLSLSYSLIFVCAYADRLLIPFYAELSGWSPEVCGSLTLSITLGLIHGLLSGSQGYAHLLKVQEQQQFLRRRNMRNVVTIACMAVLAHLARRRRRGLLTTTTGSYASLVMASTVFVFSAAMASAVSFEFFQMPAIIAQNYKSENKAVCISFLDGFGYLFSIPIFSALGVVVPRYGWDVAWALLAAMSLLSGAVFVRNMGPILAGAPVLATTTHYDNVGQSHLKGS
jgi:Major Facilitator Superfamily